jgi:nucleotide-binding universal stress UspA family protein
MSYKTIMVHLELGRSNAGLLKVAGDLAERSASNVIGIAASQPLVTPFVEAAYISGDIFEQERQEFEREAREAETEFRELLQSRASRLDWQCASGVASLADYIAHEARSADVILTAPHRAGSLLPEPRRVHIGDLVMYAGRPILVVPENCTSLQLDQVLLAWKDTREARRAASDALPLLKLAGNVTVAEVVHEADSAGAESRIADVVTWLACHGIIAVPRVEIANSNEAIALRMLAHTLGADAVVAGAYGHNRLREWAFGGVTMDLLINPSRCTLLSH